MAVQLTPQEETELCAQWRAGARAAGDKIITQYSAFVASVVYEYRKWGVPTDDLLQEARMGLLFAAERFDASHNCRLVTYAGYWIRSRLREFCAQNYRIVRLGTSKGTHRLLRSVRKRSDHRDPEALAIETGLTVERVKELLPLLTAAEVQLDHEPQWREEQATSPSPEEQTCAAEAARVLRSVVAQLPARERKIVEDRHFGSATLDMLGAHFGVSKERVRQLEERALSMVQQQLDGVL